MVFAVLSVWSAGEASHREVDSGRAELPLVVSPGCEVAKAGAGKLRAQHVPGRSVHEARPGAGRLVLQRTLVAQQGKHEPMANARKMFPMRGEPRDGTDGGGRQHKAVGVARLASSKKIAKMDRHSNSRQIVVGEGRVTIVRKNQDLVLRGTIVDVLRDGHAARTMRRAYDGVVASFRQRLQ